MSGCAVRSCIAGNVAAAHTFSGSPVPHRDASIKAQRSRRNQQIPEGGRRMVEISKVPVICRRAFYADLASAGAAVGVGSAADAATLAALAAAAQPPQPDPDYADLHPEPAVDLAGAHHLLAHHGVPDS